MDKRSAVYMMTNKTNGTLYIGVTSDLVRRVHQHRTGEIEGFSKRYGTKRLVWYEWHATMEAAISREKILKKWSRLWKLKLVNEFNVNWEDLYPLLLPHE